MDTVVHIELADNLTSKDRKRGDKFAIRLSSPIVIDGRTLAPAGATGVGEVVYAEHGGGGGSPGKLVLAARYIDAGPVRIRLKAFNLAAAGDSDFRQMQIAAEFVGPLVLLMNGHDVIYPAGTRARAKVAEDVMFPASPPRETPGASPSNPNPANSTTPATPSNTPPSEPKS